MSEPFEFNRRDFLKLAGVGAAAAVSGCAKPPAERLIPYLIPPEDILPGVPYWYASTCRECPAGCGVLVKTREGRAIKIEGNPEHPVNRGGLCGRGQAALQGLYDPDRVRGPMQKVGGAWKPIAWDQALKLASDRIGAARGKNGIALVTDHAPGSLERLFQQWSAAAGGTHLVYEPFSRSAAREASRRTFGLAAVPAYDLAKARCVVSFGADFIETFGSPAGYARDFAAMRGRHDDSVFISVEPRLSLTGANADEWIAIRPGGEMALALGMVGVIIGENLSPGVADRAAIAEATSAYTPEAVEKQTDVPADTVRRLARLFAQRRPAVAVAGGIASQSEQSVAMLAAVNLLNLAVGAIGTTVRFDRSPNDDAVGSFADLQQLAARMNEGAVEVLVVHGANPVYAAPSWSGFAGAMDKVAFKISLSSAIDETTEHCDLILPSTHWLESVGDAEAVRGVHSVIQPSMQKLPMFDARPAGDTLIALAQASGFGAGFPASWLDYVKQQWKPLHARLGAGRDFEAFWVETLAKGGVWEDVPAPAVKFGNAPVFAAPELRGAGEMALVLYPSPSLYDGRGANKPWLQELPDPTSKGVWGSWVEIHPETAQKLGVANGDALKIETEAGSVELPAYLYGGIRKDVIAVPLGQGHTSYGRYATGIGVNALALLPPGQDAASGVVAYLSARAKVAKSVKTIDFAMTQQGKNQADREIGRVIPLAALLAAGTASTDEGAHAGEPKAGAHWTHEESNAMTRLGKYTEPRKKAAGESTPAHAISAFVPEEHVRGPRQIPVTQGSYARAQHRWAMAIDLDSCTGCSACVVACNAENNVPMVGPELIKRGREMMWIRIERWEEKVAPGKHDVRFVPMMCQQCGDAPCEIVCPVYATYHNPEGLNAQVYNRCVGTRYCSNNCPYKVRSFNWFDYSAPEKATFAFPEPLNWQLNPDVTVRSKGVMEKCTFCIQRILEGKGNARDENRALRDGEIQSACAQSCPTQAIVFGDLMDPQSKVSKLSHDDRRYWVLGDLNTKPGVTYLKKIVRESA